MSVIKESITITLAYIDKLMEDNPSQETAQASNYLTDLLETL